MSTTTTYPAPVPALQPVPRRLAPNIVFLFAVDGPPVANPPRRGRFPGNVVRLASRPRLTVGDLCEMCRGALPANHGKRVRVVGFTENGFVQIVAESVPLDIYSVESGEPSGQAWRSQTRAENLRRVAQGARNARH